MTTIDFKKMLAEARLEAKKASANCTTRRQPFFAACSESFQDFSRHRVECGDFGSVFYVPGYLSEREENLLVRCIYGKQDYISLFGDDGFDWKELEESDDTRVEWVSLTKRRLKNIGGVPHPGLEFLPLIDFHIFFSQMVCLPRNNLSGCLISAKKSETRK